MTIKGSVNEALEAKLRIDVYDVAGQPRVVEALIDTGFNGFLTLPSKLIGELRLPWLMRQEGQLADGTFQVFDVYSATIIWDQAELVVEVESVDAEPLLGMGILEDYSLRIDVTRGGRVTVRALS